MSGSHLSLGGPAGGAHPAVVSRRLRELGLLGATGLIALGLALGIVAAVPNPDLLLTILAVLGGLVVIYLMVNPRLDVTVVLLAVYLGCLDGPVKLLSGGGNSVSALRDVLVAAVCIGAILRQMAKKEPWRLPPLSGFVLGFVLIVALEALNPNTVGYVKILGGFRQQLEWVPFFFFGYLLIRSKQSLRKLFLLLGVIALANSLVSAYQVRLNPHAFATWGPGYAEKVLGTNGVSGTTFSSEGAGRVRPLALGSDIGFGGTVGVIALPVPAGGPGDGATASKMDLRGAGPVRRAGHRRVALAHVGPRRLRHARGVRRALLQPRQSRDATTRGHHPADRTRDTARVGRDLNRGNGDLLPLRIDRRHAGGHQRHQRQVRQPLADTGRHRR